MYHALVNYFRSWKRTATPSLDRIVSLSLSEAREALVQGQELADHFTLPFQRGRVAPSHLYHSGSGSSLEFQEHRLFLFGDDPHRIDWQAFARTDQYLLRSYREETRPLVDIAIDDTASMRLTLSKAKRSLEILGLCQGCAIQVEASPRIFRVAVDEATPTSYEEIAYGFSQQQNEKPLQALAPAWTRVPWRHGAMHILISDLLFPENPEKVLPSIASKSGQLIVLVPFDAKESHPQWEGSMDLQDCESMQRQTLRFDSATLTKYRTLYGKHFSLWRIAAQQHRGHLARILSGVDFLSALKAEALPMGSIRLRS